MERHEEIKTRCEKAIKELKESGIDKRLWMEAATLIALLPQMVQERDEAVRKLMN